MALAVTVAVVILVSHWCPLAEVTLAANDNDVIAAGCLTCMLRVWQPLIRDFKANVCDIWQVVGSTARVAF